MEIKCGKTRNPEETSTYFLLFQANHKYIQLFLHKLQKLDLKIGQAGILFILGKYGPQSQREIADKICLTPPSVTVAVQKLEQSGLTVKRPDEEDQRRTIIDVTEKGKSYLSEIKNSMQEIEDIMFQGRRAAVPQAGNADDGEPGQCPSGKNRKKPYADSAEKGFRLCQNCLSI